MKKIISTEKAPEAIGPYSQAISAGGAIFISGQLGIDPETGEFSGEDVESQAEQALLNLKAILESADLSLKQVVKTTVMLADINDFKIVNEIYAKYFPEEPPARAAYQVAALPKNAKIEIEAIAVR